MKSEEEVSIFSIVDDCYPDPFPIPLTTAVEDISAAQLGLHATTLIDQQRIHFTLVRAMTLPIQLFDMNGKMIFNRPVNEFTAGANTISIEKYLLPGMYFLATEIDGKPVRVKLIRQ